jgi:hypothetical protein
VVKAPTNELPRMVNTTKRIFKSLETMFVSSSFVLRGL